MFTMFVYLALFAVSKSRENQPPKVQTLEPTLGKV